jgi:hypothetical protein
MIKKITGTRSCIRIEFDDKTIEIEGELTLTPAFYADKKSMKNLTRPEMEVSENEKECIVNEILNYEGNIKIIFET